MPRAKQTISAKQSKYLTSDGRRYLTKRMTVNRAKVAGRKAARKAMSLMGYVVVRRGNYIVRLNQDGSVTQISKIA